MAFIVAQTVACDAAIIVECLPISAWWDVVELTTAKCVNLSALVYSSAALTLGTDILVLVMPLSILYSKSSHPPLKSHC